MDGSIGTANKYISGFVSGDGWSDKSRLRQGANQRELDHYQFILDLLKLKSKLDGIAHMIELPGGPTYIKGKVCEVAAGWEA